jgi:hypothetical protein
VELFGLVQKRNKKQTPQGIPSTNPTVRKTAFV